jgi:hypothetical protein
MYEKVNINFIRKNTVGWGEYGTAGGEIGLLSQERDVMEENITL